jgi:hypothetical protein
MQDKAKFNKKSEMNHSLVDLNIANKAMITDAKQVFVTPCVKRLQQQLKRENESDLHLENRKFFVKLIFI